MISKLFSSIGPQYYLTLSYCLKSFVSKKTSTPLQCKYLTKTKKLTGFAFSKYHGVRRGVKI